MCEFSPMILWLALRRLLVALAVVSLALAPATASAVPAGDAALMMAMADPASDGRGGMVMDDMPCCPPAEPVMPDCQKSCPLAALCLAKVASALPSAAALPMQSVTPLRIVWGDPSAFHSVALRLPPEPPRS